MTLPKITQETHREYIEIIRTFHNGLLAQSKSELTNTLGGDGWKKFLSLDLPILPLQTIGLTSAIIRDGHIGNGSVAAAQDAIAHLEGQAVSRIDVVREFLAAYGKEYPHTRTYIIMTDYQRLLAIEYLRLFQLNQEDK